MNHAINNALKLLKANAPEILTALGVGGVISTAVLTAKATLKAERLIDESPLFDSACISYIPDQKARRKAKVKLIWKDFIPPAASAAVTIAAIIASHKTGSRRTAAAVTAYSLTEKAFSEYREKAADVIGKQKEQKIRDEIAQDKVNANPPTGREIVVVGSGNVLCLDTRSMHYFRSKMEDLKKAQNDVNWQLNYERYIPLSEFYALVGIPLTKESVYTGWKLDKGLMELEISTTVADNDEPCLVVDYNYCDPLHDDPFDPICLAGSE
jgi:hypothetical protein